MKRLPILFAFILASGFCFAQNELPTVVPDRPGHTFGADITHFQKLGWDNGFSFEKASNGTRTFTLNSTILRYGLFQNMELRVGTDFLMYDNEAAMPIFGIAPLTVGTKIKFNEGSGIIPSVGFLAELKSPHVGSKDLLPSHLAPAMYAIFEHSIGERFSISYNAGLEWNGETATPTTFLAFALGYNFTESFGAFVETYNYLHPEEANQYMTEFGLTWLVSRRVQLDLEADLDFQNLGKYFSIGAGVAWMIN